MATAPYEIHIISPSLKLKCSEGKKGDACKAFPSCDHSLWEAACPRCGREHSAEAVTLLGPYICRGCDYTFLACIDCWCEVPDGKA